MIAHHHNPCQATSAPAAAGIPHLLPAKPFAEQQRGVALTSKSSDNSLSWLNHLLEVHQTSLHFSPVRPFCPLWQCLQRTDALRALLCDFSACNAQATVVNTHIFLH